MKRSNVLNELGLLSFEPKKWKRIQIKMHMIYTVHADAHTNMLCTHYIKGVIRNAFINDTNKIS